MKKLTSLVLAIVSTMFLFAGATQAAEKFDPSAAGNNSALADSSPQLPTPPCVLIED